MLPEPIASEPQKTSLTIEGTRQNYLHSVLATSDTKMTAGAAPGQRLHPQQTGQTIAFHRSTTKGEFSEQRSIPGPSDEHRLCL